MAKTSQTSYRAALLVSSVAVLGLLTACGNGTGVQSSPEKVSGTAAPATDDSTNGTDDTGGSGDTDDSTAGSSASATGGGGDSTTASSGKADEGSGAATAGSTRCHTSQLSASVGRNNPGAGQENFPIVFTNKSGQTCTLHGYPGAAFVDASGSQLGPDPKRTSGSPSTVTLKPGQSAWAGLTFSNPGVSGAKTGKPATLVVTPPDERDSLKVTWKGGEVPVSGNASSVRLTVLTRGTGA